MTVSLDRPSPNPGGLLVVRHLESDPSTALLRTVLENDSN